jgi:hypothetical protein
MCAFLDCNVFQRLRARGHGLERGVTGNLEGLRHLDGIPLSGRFVSARCAALTSLSQFWQRTMRTGVSDGANPRNGEQGSSRRICSRTSMIELTQCGTRRTSVSSSERESDEGAWRRDT